MARITDRAYYRPLRRMVVGFLLLVSFVPLCSVGSILYVYYRASLKWQVMDHLESRARDHRDDIKVFISERIANLEVLLESDPVGEEKLTRYFGPWKHVYGDYEDVLVADQNGVVIARSGGSHVENVWDQLWFQTALGKGSCVRSVFPKARDQMPEIIVAVRKRFGTQERVAKATIRLQRLNALIESMHFGKTGEVALIDEEGTYLTEERFAGASGRVQSPGAQERGRIVLEDQRDYRGRRVLCAHYWLTGFPLGIAVKQDEEEAFAAIRKARNAAIGIFSIGGGVIAVAVWIIASHLVGRIEASERQRRGLERDLARSERLASVGRFAAGLAHEIRNPLNSVEIQLLLMERRITKGAPEGREDLLKPVQVIREEVIRLEDLVKDFLVFSRPSDLERSYVDVRSMLKEVMGLFETEAEHRSVSLHSRYTDPLPAAWIDRTKMKQVLINVLKNALEATTEGTVTVEAFSSEDDLTIRVADTGAGISEDDMEHVFDLFYTTKEGGTGLGLSIVRQIVEDHGGRAEIESTPGQGTRCTLVLPLRPPAGEHAV